MLGVGGTSGMKEWYRQASLEMGEAVAHPVLRVAVGACRNERRHAIMAAPISRQHERGLAGLRSGERPSEEGAERRSGGEGGARRERKAAGAEERDGS